MTDIQHMLDAHGWERDLLEAAIRRGVAIAEREGGGRDPNAADDELEGIHGFEHFPGPMHGGYAHTHERDAAFEERDPVTPNDGAFGTGHYRAIDSGYNTLVEGPPGHVIDHLRSEETPVSKIQRQYGDGTWRKVDGVENLYEGFTDEHYMQRDKYLPTEKTTAESTDGPRAPFKDLREHMTGHHGVLAWNSGLRGEKSWRERHSKDHREQKVDHVHPNPLSVGMRQKPKTSAKAIRFKQTGERYIPNQHATEYTHEAEIAPGHVVTRKHTWMNHFGPVPGSHYVNYECSCGNWKSNSFERPSNKDLEYHVNDLSGEQYKKDQAHSDEIKKKILKTLDPEKEGAINYDPDDEDETDYEDTSCPRCGSDMGDQNVCRNCGYTGAEVDPWENRDVAELWQAKVAASDAEKTREHMRGSHWQDMGVDIYDQMNPDDAADAEMIEKGHQDAHARRVCDHCGIPQSIHERFDEDHAYEPLQPARPGSWRAEQERKDKHVHAMKTAGEPHWHVVPAGGPNPSIESDHEAWHKTRQPCSLCDRVAPNDGGKLQCRMYSKEQGSPCYGLTSESSARTATNWTLGDALEIEDGFSVKSVEEGEETIPFFNRDAYLARDEEVEPESTEDPSGLNPRESDPGYLQYAVTDEPHEIDPLFMP